MYTIIIIVGCGLIIVLICFVILQYLNKTAEIKAMQTTFLVEQAEKRRQEGLTGSIEKSEKFDELERIRLTLPGYDRIVNKRNNSGLNSEFNLRLAGIHTPTIRGYFSTVVKQFQIVELVPEPNNRKNPRALAVKMERKKLGYIPTKLLDQIWEIYHTDHYLAYISSIQWDEHDNKYSYLYVHMTIEYKQ